MAEQRERERLVICMYCKEVIALGSDHFCPCRNPFEVRIEQLVNALNGAGVATDGSHAGTEPKSKGSFPWVLIAHGEENLSWAKILVSAYNRSILDPKYRWRVENFPCYKGGYKEERWRVAPARENMEGRGADTLAQFIFELDLDPVS